MTPWEQFKREAVGATIRIARRECDWVFELSEGRCICVESAWRVRDATQILATDMDEGQQFGLPAPIDAAERANEALQYSTVLSLEHDPATADLKIQLSKGLLIEVLTNSSGYESWQAYSKGDLAGVGGNGGLR